MIQRIFRTASVLILVALVLSNLNCSQKKARVGEQKSNSSKTDSEIRYSQKSEDIGRSPASLPEEKTYKSKIPEKNYEPKVMAKKAAKKDYGDKKKTSAPPSESGSQNIDDIVDSELQKLTVGKILFNPPAEMKVGSTERVEVRIEKSELEGFAEGLKGKGEPQIESIKVGTFMQAHLNGMNFEIISLSHEEQLVSSSAVTQWDWDVTPLKSGEQKLELTVTVRIVVANHGVEKKDYPVFERQIKVKINPVYSIKNFLKVNWQWIISTIIGSGIIGWFTNRYIKKRKKKR
jgi:hypothetical protein